MNLIVAGAMVNSALYFIGVFLMAHWAGNAAAMKVTLVAVAVTYLSYVLQSFPRLRPVSAGFVILSIAFGALAGLMVL